MLPAGADNDEFFCMRDTWLEFAARYLTAGYLAKQDAEHVGIAFSQATCDECSSVSLRPESCHFSTALQAMVFLVQASRVARYFQT